MNDEVLLRYFRGECTDSDLDGINFWIMESEENRNYFFLFELAFNSKQIAKYSNPLFLKISKDELERKIQIEMLSDAYKSRFSLWVGYVSFFIDNDS